MEDLQVAQVDPHTMGTAAKAYKGVGLEGVVAKWYAKNTARSMDDFRADARRVAALLQPNDKVLEIAPGPGYFAIELAKLNGMRVIGLDISRTFVEIAERNAAQAGVSAEFRLGSPRELFKRCIECSSPRGAR